MIFCEGEQGEGVHFVNSGSVKIIKSGADGREHIIKIVHPGEVFAEVLLFSQLPYPATAVAMEDSIIGIIKNTDMEKLVSQNGVIALALIKALSTKLLYVQGKIKSLALHDVLARTSEAILNLDTTINSLSRQELADLVGTTRETVTRMLTLLKHEGIISLNNRTIKIVDKARLSMLAKSN